MSNAECEWICRFRPLPGKDGWPMSARMRALLKCALRTFGVRCIGQLDTRGYMDAKAVNPDWCYFEAFRQQELRPCARGHRQDDGRWVVTLPGESLKAWPMFADPLAAWAYCAEERRATQIRFHMAEPSKERHVEPACALMREPQPSGGQL